MKTQKLKKSKQVITRQRKAVTLKAVMLKAVTATTTPVVATTTTVTATTPTVRSKRITPSQNVIKEFPVPPIALAHQMEEFLQNFATNYRTNCNCIQPTDSPLLCLNKSVLLSRDILYRLSKYDDLALEFLI